VDGIPINDLYSTDVDLSSIPVTNIARIVVNRGSSSALYGTDGAVGSVNVVTRKPGKPFVDTTLRLGPTGNQSLSLAHGAPVGRFYYWMTASAEEMGGFVPSARLDEATRRSWFDKAMRYDLFGVAYDDVAFPAKAQYLGETGRWDHHELNTFNASAKAGYRLFDGWEIGVSGAVFSREGMTNTYQAAAISDYNAANDKWRVNRRPYFGNEFSSVKDFALRNRAFVWPVNWRATLSPYLDGKAGNFSLRVAPFFFLGHGEQEGYAATDHSFTKGPAALFTDRRDPLAYDPFRDIKTYGSYGLRLLPSYGLGHHRLSGSLHWRTDLYEESGRAVSGAISPNIAGLVGMGEYPVSELSAQRLSLALEYEGRFFERLKVAAGVSYDAQKMGTFRRRDGMDFGGHYVVRETGLVWGTRDSLNPVAGLVYDAIRRRLRFRVAGSMKTRFPTLGDYEKVADESLDRELKPERSYNGNAGVELFLFNQAVSLRTDYFHTTVDNRIARISSDEPPVNVDRITVQGFDTVITTRWRGLPGGLLSLESSLSHTYLHARNHDRSAEESVNKGETLEFTPEHQISAEVRLRWRFGTSLALWGTWLYGASIYVMQAAPDEFAPYSTDFFTTLRLHDPVMLNVKVSQQLLAGVELYALARNLMDDYGMDPFNPGAGRMVYCGLTASW
jgi:outer membrane receptor protein involved in Fe transport